MRCNNTCIGKVQRQPHRFSPPSYQKPTHLSIYPHKPKTETPKSLRPFCAPISGYQSLKCLHFSELLLFTERRTLRAVAVLRLGAVTTTDLNAVQGAVVLTTSVVVTSGDVALDAVVYLIHILFASFGLAPLIWTSSEAFIPPPPPPAAFLPAPRSAPRPPRCTPAVPPSSA